jgi:ABC-type lipoprotein export system ATPase subunit
VSFDIAQSEFLCPVGPSGCGKTTLLNIHYRIPENRPTAKSTLPARP